MSKISTRKGLAFGALIALGSSVIAGAPANAADLSLAPSLGTTYSVLLGDTFTLNSAVTGNTNIANTAAWKWEVVNTSGVTVGVAGTYWDETAGTPAYATSSLATTSTGTTKVYTPGATKVTDVIGKVNTITLDPSTDSTTATFSVTVRSFSDLDSSGSVTAGDLVSDAKTVTFVKGSEVTGTIAIDDVNAGVAPSGTLSFDKDINVEQTTLPTAVFTINGTAGTGVTAALNTAKTGFTLTHGSTASAGNIVSVKASWLRYDSDSTKASATSATKTALAASDADTAAVTLANSDDIAAGSGTYAAGADANLNKIVRAGVKTVAFTTAFTKSGVAVAAGQPVTVTVAEADAATDLAAGTVITAGGKELKDTGAGTTDSVTYYTTTNADGKVVVTITSDDATAADHILVSVTANTGTAEVALLWATAVAHTLQELNTPLLTTTRVIKAGSSVAVSYRLQDQFGKAFTKTDYNYRLVLSASSGAITINSPIVTLANGVGTATVLENDPAAAGFTLLASAQVQTGTGSWGALNDASAAAITRSSVVTVVSAVAVPSSITLATAVLGDASAIASTGVVLADKDLTALDLRFNANSGTALGLTNTTAAKLVGTVKQADGSVASGVSVTVSAPGVAFSVDATGSSVVSLGSITVNTTTGGEYTVYAFSKKSGAITVTHTAGAVSKTQAITWAKAAASSATAVSIEAATVAKAGRTLPVTVKLVDKYGNAVDTAAADGLLTVTVEGPGYTTTIADNTDSNGLVKFNVILGSADAGAIKVTASYDSNGATADVAGTTVLASATKTTLVGISASVSAGSKKANVVVKNAEGLTVKVVSGTKSTTKVATSDSYKLSLSKLTSGSKTVKVYVNDILVSSKKVTVRR